MSDAREGKAGMGRRDFLGLASIVTVVAAFLAQGFSYLRALVPNILYERPQRFKIGGSEKFADGYTFLEDEKLFLVKEGNSFFAMSATCTHLGCTVKYVQLNQPKVVTEDGKQVEIRQEFHCPCHGSKFYGDGRNYAGPAPRPLDRFQLTRSPDDGQLVVDLDRRVEADYRLTV